MTSSTQPGAAPEAGLWAGVSSRSPLAAVFGLLLAFGWLYALNLTGLTQHRLADVHDNLVSIAAKWLVVLLLCLVAFAVQRFRPADLGMRSPGWREILAPFAGTIAALLLSGAATKVVALPSSLSDLKAIAAMPLSVRLGMVLTAAFCEEFIYRGFAIEELALFVRNRWLAGFVSLAFFTLGHAALYGFSAALVIPGVIGAVLTLLYLWRRNLFSCILMHTFIDGLFLIVFPFLVVAATPGK